MLEASKQQEKMALVLLLAETAAWPVPWHDFPDVWCVRAKLHELSLHDEDWPDRFKELFAAAAASWPERWSNQLLRTLRAP